MSKLVWDKAGDKLYETGVDHGVLYPQVNGAYPKGVAWNGLTGFTETPSGADASPIYADNIKYVTLRAAEEFGATIEAYMYPDEWAECDGSVNVAEGVSFGQQKRKAFGFSCRTIVGNDTANDTYGYKLHLMYNATASPSERAYASVNDSPEAITFSWEVTTTPIETSVVGTDGGVLKPVALITIDSTKVDASKLAALEAKLYGSDSTDGVPTLPLPDEVYEMFKDDSTGARANSFTETE